MAEQHDDSLLSSRTSVLLFEYLSEETKANSFSRQMEINFQMAKLGYGSTDQFMPMIEAYTGYDKYTGGPVFVKKFRDFKIAKFDL